MPYDKQAVEHGILDHWKKNKTFYQLQERNSGKKVFSFIDGPITANNPMGVHHAWGRTLKDLYQRYFALRGYDERYQNGFDCQGLWLEVETEKDLGFNSKKDIEHFGLDKFSKACRQRVEKFSNVQTEQSKRLGQWMDWGNDYFTMSNQNIEAIWFFLKKCFDQGWLYKGKRVLPWCIRCGTSSSKHEMSDEGYADLTHDSVYVKAKLKSKENEYLLIWTTTEWTLSSNVAAAVNPHLDYVKVLHHGDVYYLAKAALPVLYGDYGVLQEMKGKDLLGWEYENFYPDFSVQRKVKPSVVPWEEVGETEGTGIVHIAPSCGDSDYQLGKQLKLAMLDSALDEFGNYTSGFGWLSGQNVRDVKKKIVEELDDRGLIYKIQKYTHRYPVCWRCKEELVFRADTSWFISCEDLRPKMKRESNKVEWYPPHVGKLMQDWLDNMEDWNISRRRYWGLPLMFYECTSCEKLTVIGSREELRNASVDKKKVDALPELHRPWIDEIQITCSCGANISRIPDVGDCWLDAGIVPYSTLHYFDDKTYWKKWFPAELEIEGRPQIRLWFYAQLFMSVVLEGKAPYKRVLAYEEVRDEKGESMHKSKGNAIWFDDAAEKMGADIMRWQYCGQNPMHNLNFGYGPAKEIERHLTVIWNLGQYVRQSCSHHSKSYNDDGVSKWILSRRDSTIKLVSVSLESLEYHKAMEALKKYLLEDLSRGYGQYMREQLEDSKVQKVLSDCFLTGLQLLSPFLPFITERLYLDLYGHEKSIFLESWPTSKKYIDEKLEQDMLVAEEVMQALLNAREKVKFGVRWPLKGATVHCQSSEVKDSVLMFKDLLLRQVNLKNLDVQVSQKKIYDAFAVAFKSGVVVLNTSTDEVLECEGYVREVMRRVQSLRRKAGLRKEDRITLHIESTYSLEAMEKEIKEKVGASTLIFGSCGSCAHKDTFDVKGVSFLVGFNKV